MNLLTQIKHKTQKGEEVIMDIGAKASNVLPENFVDQKERSNLTAKDKLPVIFGKLSKWYADLRPVAWSGSYSDLTNKPTIPEGSAANYQVANNDTTTQPGFVPDARIVKVHGDEIDALSRDFAGGQMEIRLTEAGKGEYRKKGADTWLPFSATKIILVAEVWITWSYDGRKCTSQKITYTFNRNHDGSWTWEVTSTEGNDGFVAGSSASGSTIWHHLKILSIEIL